MTFERKILVGLDDIKSVVFECLGCRSRLALSPDELNKFPQHCSRCPQQWIPPDPDTYSSTDSPFSNFLRGITQIRTLIGAKAVGVKILLEFDEPKADAK
jgi:hypothetical protein